MAVGLDQDTESLQRGSIPSGGAGTLSDGGFKNCFAGVWVYRPSSTATYALTAAGSIIHFQSGAREVVLGFNSAGSALADLNLQIIFNSGGGAGTPATFSGHTGASFLDEFVYYFIADNPTDGQIAGYIRLADLATAVTQTRTNDNAGSQYINTLTFGNNSSNNAVVLGYYAYARAAYDSTDGFNTTDALAFAASSAPGSGMWGFWPADTNTDNVDDSGNGRDLTFNGTLTTETSPSLTGPAPTISVQPTAQTVNAGATATFSVTATGGSTPYTYQWQDNSSGSFANISGATSSSYVTAAATYAMQGRLYRCNVTGADAQTVTSDSAPLVVAFNLTGTGPRAYPVLGGVIGAGSVESWLRGGASSGSSFEHIASGGFSFSGAAAAEQARNFTFGPSGGLTLSGAASAVEANDYAATASGGFSFAGAADAQIDIGFTFNGSGGITLGGTASAAEANDYTHAATGGITLAGAATVAEANDYTASASGGIVLAGAAAATLDVGFTVTGSGGITFAGSAIAEEANDYAVTSSGGFLFGGEATVEGPPPPGGTADAGRSFWIRRRGR